MPDFRPFGVNELQRRIGVSIFGMDADEISSRFCKLFDLIEEDCVRDHEMDMQGFCRGAARCRNKIGEEQQRRREMSIGHVDVKNVGEGLNALDVVNQAAEVSGPQGHLGKQTVTAEVFRANPLLDGGLLNLSRGVSF